MAATSQTPDAAEGIAAFLDKRAPSGAADRLTDPAYALPSSARRAREILDLTARGTGLLLPFHQGRDCGSGFAGEEGAELRDRGHDRGREHDGGVLVHADLDQALQVA